MAPKTKKTDPTPETPEQSKARIAAAKEKFNFKSTSELIDEYVNKPVIFCEPLSVALALNHEDPFTGLPGIPQGTIIEVGGSHANGKTMWAEHFIKHVLDADPTNLVAVVFFEPMNMLRMLKVFGEERMERILRLERSSGDSLVSAEEGLHTLLNFCATIPEIKAAVIDSIGAMPTSRELYDKNGDFKPLDVRSQLGHRASVMTEFTNQWNALNPNTRPTLVGINHMKTPIDTGDATVAQLQANRIGFTLHYNSPGGEGFKFACDIRMKIMAKKPDPTTEAEKEKHALFGNRLMENLEIHYDIFKNKLCPDFGAIVAQGSFNLKEGRFDIEDEIISYADFLGYPEIRKAGAYIYVEGAPKALRYAEAIEYLRNNDELKWSLIRKLTKDRSRLFGTTKKATKVDANETL